MIETEKLENILKKFHIIKRFVNLPDSVLGYYTYNGGYCIILINESIKDDERLYRTVLAEEIGHYSTTIGDVTPRKYMRYSERIKINKYELRALKWATDFLIPTDMILEYIKKGFATTIDDLTDYFFVTQDFLIKKLDFMAKLKHIWALNDNRYLYLYNLPSICVFEKGVL